MATKRANQSGAWEHMDRVAEGKVQCRLCGKLLTYSKSRSTSPLLKHLTSRHPEVTDMRRTSSEKAQLSAASSVGVAELPCDSGRQEKISELLLNAALVNRLPLSIVKSKEFRELLLFIEPSYKIPSEKTMATWLEMAKSNVCSESAEVSISKMEKV